MNGIHPFWEDSETIVDGHCISFAFVFNRLSSQRRVRSMGRPQASRNSHKMYNIWVQRLCREIYSIKSYGEGRGMGIQKRQSKRSRSKTDWTFWFSRSINVSFDHLLSLNYKLMDLPSQMLGHLWTKGANEQPGCFVSMRSAGFYRGPGELDPSLQSICDRFFQHNQHSGT